ncbi:uncharacterized protein PV09_07693 [Verruconis gallopava]|uniref:Uncharacterized protein n=1 Tax=Verruconis gallopava TaxID=253628 RepID=A0A0D1YIL4_9PEZI|nr:uncharacterized protein PV09_07693 [Verruconis gallopava]KIW00707.1 hypothetical protein PV09_07693 [Verruconis gallopava]
MSGGFDFPPASDTSTPIGSLTQRFDNLRQTFQSDRSSRPHIDHYSPSNTSTNSQFLPTPPPTIPRPRRRIAHPRGMSSSTTSNSSVSNGLRPRSAGSAPSPGFASRWRQLAEGTRAHMRRLREEMSEESGGIAGELRERRDLLDRMSEHLDEAETRLRGIETAPSPPTTNSSSVPSRRRSHKRRKLSRDHEPSIQSTSVLEPYGRYGQVVPGQLKMEIVFCDGGEYPGDPRSGMLHMEGGNYRPENVLRNDESVYCTRNSRCNLMLRQKGEALFHLESLIIAAPKRGYTAPIQQGLVFVGMSAEKLATSTASYSIYYPDDTSSPATQGRVTRSPTPSAAMSFRSNQHMQNPGAPPPAAAPLPPPRDSDRLSLLEAVNDDQIWQASRSRYNLAEPPYILPPPRPSMRAQYLHAPSGLSMGADGRLVPEEEGDEERERATTMGNEWPDNCDWPLPPMHGGANEEPGEAADEGITRAPTPPQPTFTVTTVMESSQSSAASSEDESEQAQRRRAARESSYGLPYALPSLLHLNPTQDEDTASDTDPDFTLEGAEDAHMGLNYRHRSMREMYRRRHGPFARPIRRSSPGRIARINMGEVDGNDECIEPNARFFMPEGDCRITIRFTPPISGKFILLKLFSPQLRDGGNIDIEYVAAHGYSGPRFFPSLEIK